MTTEAMALQALGAHDILVVRLKEIVANGGEKAQQNSGEITAIIWVINLKCLDLRDGRLVAGIYF